MPKETLKEVFHLAEFSPDVCETLGGAAVTRIAVNERSRVMRVRLFLPVTPSSEIRDAVQKLKFELCGHFSDLADVYVDVDGLVREKPEPPPAFSSNSGTRSFRKVKVNKTIPTDRQLLSVEFNNGDEVCVEGIAFTFDRRVLKSGRVLITFDIHGREPEDRYSAVSVKLFASPDDNVPLKKGAAVTVRGKVQYDDYAGELIIMADTIAPGRAVEIRPDEAEEKRVELHLHTTMSSLDGVSAATAYVKRAIEWGHPAIAITDHGVAQAFPEAANAARGSDIKILYGVEAYFVDDIDAKHKGPEAYKKLSYDHMVIFAANRVGLQNLYTLISVSHLNYFYRRPRILKSSLLEHREGLIIGSACEAGELFRAVRKGAADEKLEAIASFYDYLEIQPLGNNEYMLRRGLASSEDDLRDFNRKIVALGEKLNKPVVATCDAHFLDADDEVFRRIIQAGDGFEEADIQAPLYFRTTNEMLEEFEYLGAEKAYEVVVTNPRAIADSIEKMPPIPKESHPPIVHNAEEDVKRMSAERARALYGDPLPPIVAERMEQELASIVQNGFSGMYAIAQKLVAESESYGYKVGSRGSIGASLVATMMGITEVNPLPPHYYCKDCHFFESDPIYAGGSGFDLPRRDCPACGTPLMRDGHDIRFEIFLGFDGDKEPDIDLNFSGEYQQRAHAHAEQLLGKGQVFKSGTIATIAEKTAYGYVKKYFDAKGQEKRRAEINCLVSGCTGIKRTTGQHPGGLIVVPEGHSIYEFCPVQHPANKAESGVITTHFDYHSMEGTLFKLDILGHDVPTIIRMLHDFTGVDPTAVPYDDKDVINFFTTADSLGLPEFGTGFTRQMLLETQPSTFSELVRISGLSHGTNVWTNNGQDLVKDGVATLKEIIPSRDDIMIYLINKGIEKLTAFNIMETVRKKDKYLNDEQVGLMLDSGIPDWYVESCQKIEYLFPKAHAVAYVLMTVRIAYFKKHHPEAFYAASLSVRAADIDYATMCMGKETAEREQARLQSEAATEKDKSTAAILDLVLEMYQRGLNFAPLDVYASEVSRFVPTPGGILPPLCTVQGLGQSVAELIVTSRADGEFDTVEDFRKRTKVNKTVLELLRKYKVLEGIPETNQMSLFD